MGGTTTEVRPARILKAFEEAGAILPEEARSLEELGLDESPALRHLMDSGAVVSEPEHGYYVDRLRADGMRDRRRRRAALVLGAVLLGLALLIAL